MEKNRIRPITNGKGFRMSYSRRKEVLEMPNLIEVQKDSYQWFLDEGLKEVFDDISPIEDYAGKLSLEFVDFKLCEDDAKYSIEECVERDATYAAPLKVKVRLHNKENDEISEHEIFMASLFDPRVSIMQLPTISWVKSCIPVLLFRTVVHGWNMRQTPMMCFMCA